MPLKLYRLKAVVFTLGLENKIVVTEQIYNNLNDSHKNLLSEFVDGETTLYEGDIIRKDMDKWYNENCK